MSCVPFARVILIVFAAVACCVSPGAAIAAERELTWLYDHEPLQHWLERLEAAEPGERINAVQAAGSFLGHAPERVRPRLIDMLHDAEPKVREAAVRVLSWGRKTVDGPQAVVNALRERLVDPGEDASVRASAARALNNFGVAGARALAGAMKGIDDARVRGTALEWFSRMPHDIAERIQEMRPLREQLQLLAQQRPRPKLNLLARLDWLRRAAEQMEDPQVREYALAQLEAAESISDIVVEQLIEETGIAPADARPMAIRQLWQWSAHEMADRAVPTLVAGLRSDDEPLRFWAAAALASIAPESDAGNQAVDLLVDYFVQKAGAGEGREQLSWSLLFAAARSSRREEIFRRILAQVEGDAAATVQRAWLEVNEDVDDYSLDLVMASLEHNDESVRREAVNQLRRLGPAVAERASPALAKLLQQAGEEAVLRATLEALEEIDPAGEHTPALDPKVLVRLMQNQQYVHGHPWLVEALREQAPAVIDGLMEQLADLPQRPVAPQPGVSMLTSSQDPVVQIVHTLRYLGDPAAGALRELVLEHPEDLRGDEAADALATIDPEGTMALLELARHDGVAVRRQAVRALGRTQQMREQVLAAIIRASEDEDSVVRQEAIDSISELRGDVAAAEAAVVDGLFDDEPKVVIQAVQSLRRFREAPTQRAVEGIREVLRQEHGELTWRIRREVLQTLQSFGEAAAPALPEVRPLVGQERISADAVHAIAVMGPAVQDVESLLREQLILPHPRSRFWAAVALSRREEGLKAALPVLIELVDNRRTYDNSKSLQVLAIERLGELGAAAEPAVGPLLELLGGGTSARRREPRTQRQNQRVVRPRQGDEIPLEAIETNVDARDSLHTRREALIAAIRALGRIGREPDRVVPVLADVVAAPPWGDRTFSSEAARALSSFGADAAPAADELATNLRRNQAAGEALVAIGPAAVPALVEALQSDYQVAQPAADVLGQMGEQAAAAVSALIDVVRDGAVHWGVREAAIEALGKIGEPARAAIPYLEALAETATNPGWMHETWSTAARTALERIRGE